MVQTITPKAIYIGDHRVGDVLEKLRPDWEWIPSVSSISDFWDGLQDGSITSDIQIVLILDQFFDPEGERIAFENLISTLGSACFVGIINYSPQNRDLMRDRIDYEAESSGSADNLHYYFIDKKGTNASLDKAITRFINESEAFDTVDILQGRMTAEARSETMEEDRKSREREELLQSDDEDNPYLGQVVAVTSSKGGSGKSTVAVSLATYLAHASENSYKEGLADRPLKIVILDLDVRDGQIGFLTGWSKPTVITIRTRGVSQETIPEALIHSPRLKVDLLLAPKKPRAADQVPPEFYIELIQTLKKMYDYVILDTSVNYLDSLLEKVAYPIANQIVFVTDIVINSIFSMTRWIKEVTTPRSQGGMGISKNKIGIVVNKSLSNVSMPSEKILQSAQGVGIITVIPSNPKLIAHAANAQSMEVLLKHKDIYISIRRLARAIVGKKYKLSDNVRS